jgi:nicotinamide-nucleotide amidase
MRLEPIEMPDAHSHSTLAVAESCTGGLLMARIVATPSSGDWFIGGLVAYHAQMKFDLLGVEPGPVVTARAAEQMADGVRRLLRADVGLSTTGVAGPETEEGVPVGTVFVGVADGREVQSYRLLLDGDPDEIREQAVEFAITRFEVTAQY